MSQFVITEANNEAIEFVLQNLWDRGEIELELLGKTKTWAAQYIIQERDSGAPNWALWHSDQPILIAGLVSSDDPTGMCTWFEATEAFRFHAPEITRLVRQKLEDAAGARYLGFVEIFSACVHPRTGRWFKALGFNLDVDYHRVAESGAKIYRFVRKFDWQKEECGNVLQQAQHP